MIDWHRLLGIALTLHFVGYPLLIELEKEMAIKRQILDILIMKKGDGPFPGRMPDGLEDLAPYNLLTYKSMQETLNDWVLKELTGHYVNYRKVVSPSMVQLLPQEEFRLFAVSTRYPKKLVNESGSNWKKLQKGVYQVKRGTDLIRVIVLKEIPKAEHNLVWQLFSTQEDKVQDAARHYTESDSEMNSMINSLLAKYKAEGIHMPYTLEDFRRDSARSLLNSFTPEEILTHYKPERLFSGLPLEERLSGLAPEEVVTHYKPERLFSGLPLEERLSGLAPEERLVGLSVQELESLTKKLVQKQAAGSSVSEI